MLETLLVVVAWRCGVAPGRWKAPGRKALGGGAQTGPMCTGCAHECFMPAGLFASLNLTEVEWKMCTFSLNTDFQHQELLFLHCSLLNVLDLNSKELYYIFPLHF